MTAPYSRPIGETTHHDAPVAMVRATVLDTAAIVDVTSTALPSPTNFGSSSGHSLKMSAFAPEANKNNHFTGPYSSSRSPRRRWVTVLIAHSNAIEAGMPNAMSAINPSWPSDGRLAPIKTGIVDSAQL